MNLNTFVFVVFFLTLAGGGLDITVKMLKLFLFSQSVSHLLPGVDPLAEHDGAVGAVPQRLEGDVSVHGPHVASPGHQQELCSTTCLVITGQVRSQSQWKSARKLHHRSHLQLTKDLSELLTNHQTARG